MVLILKTNLLLKDSLEYVDVWDLESSEIKDFMGYETKT